MIEKRKLKPNPGNGQLLARKIFGVQLLQFALVGVNPR